MFISKVPSPPRSTGSRSLELDIFIDDLVDVFEQPHFPQQTRPILFGRTDTRFKSCATWADIQNEVFAA